MIGDRHYSRFAQDPGGEEVLLVGDSGFAAYRLRAEARGGKNAAPPCSLSKVQSAQLDMGTSADQVVVRLNICYETIVLWLNIFSCA
jgi:hypothetical protein